MLAGYAAAVPPLRRHPGLPDPRLREGGPGQAWARGDQVAGAVPGKGRTGQPRVKPVYDEEGVARVKLPLRPHARANFLYLIRCGITESMPSRRFLSSS